MSVEKGEGAEPRRRLATVLSADIEGFSRLCAEAEAETLAMLDRHMKDVVAPTVRQHRGRVANIAGDGIIAEFGSAVAAVKAALAIQRTVDERNVDVPPTRRLRFRIGLNLSEVVVKQRQIFGDGVNIAARAQTFANAGAVCATEVGRAAGAGEDRSGICRPRSRSDEEYQRTDSPLPNRGTCNRRARTACNARLGSISDVFETVDRGTTLREPEW